MTRWSHDMRTVITVAISTRSPRTTARFSPAPTARIDACGGLMTAVKSRMPNMPRLEMANEPPS